MTITATTLPARETVDDKYKWNKISVYESAAAWEAAVEKVQAMIPGLKAYEGRLAEGPTVLAGFLEKRETALREGDKAYRYSYMSTRVDANDRQATAQLARVSGVFNDVKAAMAFMNPELLAIGRETLGEWIATEPRLAPYHQMVDDLFRNQAHVRSNEVEEVLSLVNGPFGAVNEIYGKLNNAELVLRPAVDSNGVEHVVSQGTIDTIYKLVDREARRTAYESYTDAYLNTKGTIAAIYMTNLRQDVFNVRTQGFATSLDAALFKFNIPRVVFENLIDTFKRSLPIWHKYWAVRQKGLNQSDHQPYDIWAPLAKNQPQISFEQAVEWIGEGMQSLGDDYVAAMKRGCLEERWVDVMPNVGKRQGAFSTGTYDTHPFIMMSYDGSLSSLSTLAHELGHSMHKVLSCKNQHWANYSYTLFAAEVASNFNQALTRAYLREAKKDDVQFQIALIEEAMRNFHRYFLIMPTLARFELDVHTRVEQGQGLTAEDMMEICADLFAEAYGDTMTYDRDRVGITWATFLNHLYRQFYTYSYATGISAAHELARGILEEKDGAVQRYLDFLGMGGLRYPIDALKHAGVDMTQPDAVETTFGVLADMIDRLESLLGQQ